MNADEDREFTLNVPEDYPQTAIAGKECRFKVRVQEIKEKGLADLDDEFAKGVGDGYETMEELRASVLEDLKEQSERIAQRELESKALDEVVKGASVEMPDLAMDREIEQMIDEQVGAQQRPPHGRGRVPSQRGKVPGRAAGRAPARRPGTADPVPGREADSQGGGHRGLPPTTWTPRWTG